MKKGSVQAVNRASRARPNEIRKSAGSGLTDASTMQPPQAKYTLLDSFDSEKHGGESMPFSPAGIEVI